MPSPLSGTASPLPDIAHIIYRAAVHRKDHPEMPFVLTPPETDALALAEWDIREERFMVSSPEDNSADDEPILRKPSRRERLEDRVILYPWRTVAATAVVMFIHGYLARKYSDDKRART